MPTYNSNILLNIKISANSTTLNTETFSENIVDEIYDVLQNHLSQTVDTQEINFENVITERVPQSLVNNNYISMQSLTSPLEENKPSYTSFSSLTSTNSEYTPLTH